VDRHVTWRVVYGVGAHAVVILEVFANKTAATPRAVVGTSKSQSLSLHLWHLTHRADGLQVLSAQNAAFGRLTLSLLG
jgi:hypothetical protein